MTFATFSLCTMCSSSLKVGWERERERPMGWLRAPHVVAIAHEWGLAPFPVIELPYLRYRGLEPGILTALKVSELLTP